MQPWAYVLLVFTVVALVMGARLLADISRAIKHYDEL